MLAKLEEKRERACVCACVPACVRVCVSDKEEEIMKVGCCGFFFFSFLLEVVSLTRVHIF